MLSRGPHAYALRCGDVVVGQLQWRQRAHDRGRTGWYLTVFGAPGGERRLFVDAGLEELAADRRRDAREWADDADSAAALSAPLALARAQSVLETAVREPGARAGVLPAP